MDPRAISDELGWQPFRMWRGGEPRRTLKNEPLDGLYKHSYWVRNFEFVGTKTFFSSCMSIVAELEQHREFLLRLEADGGDVRMAVYLPGDENIGADLPWQAME